MPDEGKKTCFVVQGFGKKTDFRTGRVLDLDASYEVIKDAVEAAGLECVRADAIQHSGVIDKPMYEQILNADLVIADLSTSNVNAAYELGVRHALRPRTTIIVAEKQWHFEFDVDRNAIRTYEHLGPDLGRREAESFSKQLAEAIQTILANEDAVDSPLYTFLPDLTPPALGQPDAPAQPADVAPIVAAAPAPAPTAQTEATLRVLLDQARGAMKQSDFGTARALFKTVHDMQRGDDVRAADPYVVQQMALATYKSEQPTKEAALREAAAMLLTLEPVKTNDSETLGLWGAIHKRLWDLNEQPADLDEAIYAYQKGYSLRNDYYNGINWAYLLNVRAHEADEAGRPADAVADFVLARRIRQDVAARCEALLEDGVERDDEKYWILATRWEAAVGLEDEAAAAPWRAKAEAAATAGWMLGSTREQIARLEALLATSPLRHLNA